MSVQRRSRLSLFALFLAGAAGLAGQAADLPDDLFVTAGKAVLVDSKVPIDRVAVGSAEIAEADATSPYEVMLSGKAPGETSLIVWQKGGGKLFFDVTVRASRFLDNNRIETVRRVIAEELPGQKIAATLENNVIFLRGTAKDLTSSRRAAAIAGTMGKVVNLLYVDVPKEDEQILLKVRFASVDRSISSNLGLNIYSLGATNTVGRVTTGQFSPPTVTYTPSTGSAPASATATLSDALNLFFFRPDLNLGSTIKALEDRGLLQVLAEPNVLAEDGKQASFLAGGEYPYPVVQGGVGGSPSAVTIQFREYGVRLNFIPTITPRGTIRLQVAPEVSALDFSNAVTIQGFVVPGLNVRRVQTEVELENGQSFAIGGLIDNRVTKTLEKIPGIGDVPIIGKLFQSRSIMRDNTELVVIVTPELVKPLETGKKLPDLQFPERFLNRDIPKERRESGVLPNQAAPSQPAPASIPVEKLMESMQPETPLKVQSTSSVYGGQESQQPAPAAPASANPPTPGSPPL